VDGTAATPAIRGTDANTGIFFPAADTIAFSEGGAEAMRINSSGNVLVGTSTASGYAKASVYDASTRNPGFVFQNSTTGETDADGLFLGIGVGGSADASTAYFFNRENGPAVFGTNGSERARIDSSGNLLVNVTSSSSYGAAHRISKAGTQGAFVLSVDGGAEYAALFQDVDGGNYNGNAAAIWVGRNTSTLRSINAGGTVNASGADYAEYMTKAGDFAVAKGGVVGINADGKLTNVFSDAVSFCVKSTDPSYVGGDIWGNEDAVGKKPSPDAPQEEQDAFNDALEAARQTVDRIAFAGQVPVNVLGATAGQYIIPINDNGAIKGEAVSNPTFEQYQTAVGKVIAIESDGRAKIIVKVA